MQDQPPTPRPISDAEMTARSNLADKIAKNLNQKGVSAQDMDNLADDDPIWSHPVITSASKQNRYTPSKTTKDMVRDRLRSLEQQKFNSVFAPSAPTQESPATTD